MVISGDGGIEVVVIVTAVVGVVVLMSKKIFNCIFCGDICSVVSGSGVNSCCGSSSLAHHSHPYQ